MNGPVFLLVGSHGRKVTPSRLGPAFFLENLDTQLYALVAYIDAIRTRDEPAVPIRFLPPAERANGIEVRTGTGSLPEHDASQSPSHTPDASRRDVTRI
jgi:hypothetical protein